MLQSTPQPIPMNQERGIHGEGLPCKVPQALLCDRLEVRRLILIRSVLMVRQLHEQISLQHQQQPVGCRPTSSCSTPDIGESIDVACACYNVLAVCYI